MREFVILGVLVFKSKPVFKKIKEEKGVNFMFITLEGTEGSGKTTIAKEIIAKLTKLGKEVVYTREPGGNPIAEQIRGVILDKNNTAMDSRTEALLYAAARRQHLVDVILPALKMGKIVLCDRFIDSSIAYQGYAREIGASLIQDINDFAIGDNYPDLTYLIDVKPQVGLERISRDETREVNRLDLEKIDFHNRVYDGYKILAKQFNNRIILIDGHQSIDKVVDSILSDLVTRL